MKIELVDDAQEVNLILNDDSVRPHIGGFGNIYVDAQPFCDCDNAYVFLCSDENGIGGMFLFMKLTTVIYEVHIAALPHFRGARMQEAGKQLFKEMLAMDDCYKLTGRIPVTNEAANKYVVKVGFEHEGICKNSIFVGDELVDQNYWGLGRKKL